MGVSVIDVLSRCDWDCDIFKTTTVVQVLFHLLTEGHIMREIRRSGSANNELNVVTCVGLLCACNFKDAPVLHQSFTP